MPAPAAEVDPLAFLDGELASLGEQQLLRSNVSIDGPTGPSVERAGRRLLNFSANDYLSLANHPRLRAAAIQAIERDGAGAGASRLLGGDLPIHRELEGALAALKGTQAALVFTSGFAANLSVISALVGPGDAVFSDALNHASIIDGCRLSRAERFVYRHRDLADLERVLAGSAARRKLIVTETLFSMDGDAAPLPALCDLAERHGAILMVDEAHATGVFGEGAGLCRELGVADRVPVQMGTLGKALGAAGAYIAGDRRLIQFLLNRARSYVFSTAPHPAACGAALEAVRLVGSPDGAVLRRRLRERSSELAQLLRGADLPLFGGDFQLLAVGIPDPGKAMRVSEQLEKEGFLVRAVRPPTVPEGGSRLRVCVAAGHSSEDVQALATALARAVRAS
jgi:8-amino-7-oxononanoate synthase